jgi:dTDP-4-amino-4,6-dideoxygalactose transaminase
MQGGKWNGRGVGSWGDVGSFSFQQSKTLSCGEGGICLTNDAEIAERLYRCKHIGYSRYDAQGGAKSSPPVGLTCHNYRGLALQAQILIDQLEGLPAIIDEYNKFAEELARRTADIEGFRLQSPGRLASPQGYYALPMVFDSERWNRFSRSRLQEALAAEGAQMDYTYGPVYQHLLFNMTPDQYRQEGCPVAEHIHARTMHKNHPIMSVPENLEIIDKALHKLSDNLDELEP